MDKIEKYQKQLLEQTQKLYQETPVSEAITQAYLATPRHSFVRAESPRPEFIRMLHKLVP
jgi:hypothetical protein